MKHYYFKVPEYGFRFPITFFGKKRGKSQILVNSKEIILILILQKESGWAICKVPWVIGFESGQKIMILARD
jgi:hypothetical protein